MALFAFLFIGFLAGTLARAFKPSATMSWPATTLLGAVGAVVGGISGTLLSPSSRLFDIRPAGLLVSVIAAGAMLWISASPSRRLNA